MIRYFSHFHFARIPQFRVLWDSILQFEPRARMTAVIDIDETAAVCTDMPGCEFIHWQELERDCGDVLPFGKVEQSRSPRMFSWTYQACLPWWIMNRCTEDQFVYVDSDCRFLRPLGPYLDETPAQAFVGITPHYFPAGKENIGAGAFNNGQMWWRKTLESIEHARKWGIWAIEVFEPHEQKVLEEWPAALGDKCWIFPANLNWGPWRRDRVSGSPAHFDNGQIVQSLHAHEFHLGSGPNETLINGEFWSRSGYDLDPATIESLYLPYERELRKYA